MAAPPTTAALFKHLTGTPLADWLAAQRDEGQSLRAIADKLRDVTGGSIAVTPQTVLNWLNATEAGDAA